MTVSTPQDHLSAFAEKMAGAGQSTLVIDTFAHYYSKVVKGETGMLHDRDILPVTADEIGAYDQLEPYRNKGEQAYGNTVRIVLNGGLGTSMGLTGPKSLIRVKKDKTFLEIILRQTENKSVRLVFMNSFNTQAATQKALKSYAAESGALMFLQHQFPKILVNGLGPAMWPADPGLEWNPPGHGDVYLALHQSGLLEKLLAEGKRYAFISNSDNLGARLDPTLLGYFAANDFAFVMEVAEKTPADIKGGHLARSRDGRLVLREAAQCPADEIDAFEDINRYRYFNTNNIWVRLDQINSLVNQHSVIDLPMILNPKTLDPRDDASPPVFQIESAMGAAISLFEKASAVRVPRSRFFPVKTTNDLLAVRSDDFEYTDKEGLKFNTRRPDDQTLKIALDPRYYKKIDQMERRFPAGPPSLAGCETLTVKGDVLFEGGVTIKGKVKVVNSGKDQAVVKAGSIIDKDLVL